MSAADTSSPPPIPRPQPKSAQPIPPIPPELQPRKSPLAVVVGDASGQLQIAAVWKQTYLFSTAGQIGDAPEQLPLHTANVPFPSLLPGHPPAFAEVPEAVVHKRGTDLVVRGHARPPRPTPRASVAVEAGGRAYRAEVFGSRRVERLGRTLVFTPPEPFEALPLRAEHAYGGFDARFVDDRLQAVRAVLDADEFQKQAAFLKDTLPFKPGISYPRNRSGSGYLVMVPRDWGSVALPRIELADDLLTPQRLITGTQEGWVRQPLPALFDFIDVYTFPRSAMMAMPPPVPSSYDDVPEVGRGWVARGYCRGSIAEAKPEDAAKLIHPDVGRCAAPGLQLERIYGGETITFRGMDAERPDLALRLPAETASFRLEVFGRTYTVAGELHEVFVDLDNRRLALIWAGRIPLSRRLRPGEEEEIRGRVRVSVGRRDWVGAA